MGSKVFLRSFEKSFIKVNKSIEDKVNAMRKFRQYSFKKIYLDEKIFENDESELKTGYLNINGLVDGNHGSYLNSDHNLKHLDILVLAETKLIQSWTSDKLDDILSDWNILRRYDADDGSKHMGLMLLSSKNSKMYKCIKSVTYQKAKRKDNLQIQGLTIRFSFGVNIGFLYCRSTPSNSEIQTICDNFKECNVLMGDLNLSHRIKEDYRKVEYLCKSRKMSALKEITHPMSNNQLEYILVDKDLKNYTFVTSYNNFISDHNSISLRLGLNKNELTDEIKARINFDSESHLKSKDKISSDDDFEELPDSNRESMDEELADTLDNETRTFSRKFCNPDMATCWLNSCLQLILITMDHQEDKTMFNSELGLELLTLQFTEQNLSLDPSNAKDIIVSTEDTRIATRLSRLMVANDDENVIARHSKIIEESRFDLGRGQQCVRDFFQCIDENILDWPDVCEMFTFKITHSSKCQSCEHEIKSETTQIYLELQVPPDGSDLKTYLEDYLNEGSTFLYFCEEGCKKMSQKTRRTTLSSSEESEFLPVILTRGMETDDGYQFSRNRVSADKDITVR